MRGYLIELEDKRTSSIPMMSAKTLGIPALGNTARFIASETLIDAFSHHIPCWTQRECRTFRVVES